MQPRELKEGDLVLHQMQDLKGTNKFSSPWEGPYRVVHILRPVVVHLETEEGKHVKNSWNIEHLCEYHLQRFYP